MDFRKLYNIFQGDVSKKWCLSWVATNRTDVHVTSATFYILLVLLLPIACNVVIHLVRADADQLRSEAIDRSIRHEKISD